ncbi:uncharacterized protein BT62DRAFT_980509 [Guyanagaster necrorhizus]|uniref:MYND-type domain-containing protein n=1 Tax=Guyanagaster necrorhizus TaxID=856835 RepID=A0A9P7VT30_9AGAR|nr:uncharacterized protein BT62DRAFT_980509 [Guyanagaster necrorhizus MCA 3950]KAG7446986.1 hypothetical protein BT62DRAFT_980509 [Guyanagaster necrorhizus MCA 3950]
MPGPGNQRSKKSKSKAKPSTAPASPTPDAYLGDIDNAVGWNIIVNILCEGFELPDLTTRSGLKKVHANFDSIYRPIDKVYVKHESNDKITGGSLGSTASSFLKRLLPLLHIQDTRHVALRALSLVTYHGGEEIRFEITRHSNELAKSLSEFPDDAAGSELIVSVLAHSIPTVVMFDTISPKPDIFRSLDMNTVIKKVTESMKRPNASTYLINHASEFLSLSTLNCCAAFKHIPSAMTFLIVGLRSADWAFRCSCLGGVIRFHRHESEEDTRAMNPMKFMASITTHDFQAAMMKCAQDHDLYLLGLSIVPIIIRTEYSIAEGMFQSENPVTGQRETVDAGLPFKMWGDCLPHCTKAIRAKGNPSEADIADILDVKYFIKMAHLPAAVNLARESLKRNSHCAYFYYAIILVADPVRGLRAAKKGLECKQITPFIRFQLFQRAVSHAAELGLQKLQEASRFDEVPWREGVAFLMSALEDSKTYVGQVPPDNRHMKSVLYWNILLTTRKQLEIADEISTFIGSPPPKANECLAQETVLKLYTNAAQEWESTISNNDTEWEDIVTSEGVDDDLHAWLEELHLDNPAIKANPSCLHPKITSNHVALYRCSWCGTPSAVLRKCSRCGQTRYCDTGCQKSHWTDHKRQCAQPSDID